MRHIPEVGGRHFGQYPERGTASVAREGEPTKSGNLTFEPGGMSTINWRTLDQESYSNKASRGETNKITKSILEITQETCPDNCQVKFPSACQVVCQVTSQLNRKEGT